MNSPLIVTDDVNDLTKDILDYILHVNPQLILEDVSLYVSFIAKAKIIEVDAKYIIKESALLYNCNLKNKFRKSHVTILITCYISCNAL